MGSPTRSLGLRSLARRVSRDVATRILDRTRTSAKRLAELVEAVRPALTAPLEDERTEIEVVPRPASTAPRQPAATDSTTPSRDAAPGKRQRKPQQEVLASRELAAWTLARHLRRFTEHHRRNVFGVDPRLSAAEHDVEAIHDMRVSSRRLRAFVDVFGPRLPDKLRIRLRRGLKRVTRALGELREWDVHAQELDQRRQRAEDPVQRAGLEHVLEWVERRRARARRRAARDLAKIPWARIERDLVEATDRVVAPWVRADLDVGRDVLSALQPRIDAAFDAAPVPESLDDIETVHEVRIQMKKLRYAFELVDPAFAKGAKRLQRPLKRVQRAVGGSRDLGQLLELLRARANKLAEHRRPVLEQGLAAVIRDVESQWSRAQVGIVPALQGLDRDRLIARTRVALGVTDATETEAAAE